MGWQDAIKEEAIYWDRFMSEISTFKFQDIYMRELGIFSDYSGIYGETGDLDFKQKKILDVGGGTASILLRANGGPTRDSDAKYSWGSSGKNKTMSDGVVIDPVNIPPYAKQRYEHFGINFINDKAENVGKYYNVYSYFDECIIYNCLQHVEDPIKILDNVCKISKKIRISEPINVETDSLHLHTFTTYYFEKYFEDNEHQCEIKKISDIGGVHHYTAIYKISN